MKAVVFAYNNIGCVGINSLIENNVEIIAIFTHKDSKNENIWFDSVAELATKNNIPVYAPENINHYIWVERIKKMSPDIIFSFYYRDIINEGILNIPTVGAFNLHGSYLPAYRGRCPINWALVNGEKESGVTLHRMTDKPDAGDIVGQKQYSIDDNDTAIILHKKAANSAKELLAELLPIMQNKKIPAIRQDESKATYFGGRSAKDGEINWNKTSQEIKNLVRAVTNPYPGAFTFSANKKFIIWNLTITQQSVSDKSPGTILSANPLLVATQDGVVKIESAQEEDAIIQTGSQLAEDSNLVVGTFFGADYKKQLQKKRKKRVLILGVNGFIGNALTERLLKDDSFEVFGMDLNSNHIGRFLDSPNFHFEECDISIHREWLEYHIRKCDIVLPLIAIATPIEYTRNPLRVFELDFEENLRVVRYCAKYNKRLLFPSTSEVYGMCTDPEFDEETSPLILGPINKQRWIYSCSKQLLDRVIWAYGAKEGLNFTLFRPFNWIGPRLDSLDSARIGSSRAITQMILNLVDGTPILLIDGGEQKRCFTDVEEGIECLYRIIENKDDICNGKIFNIGNPVNEASIKQQAELLVEKFQKHPLYDQFPPFAGMKVLESKAYYGDGYQDVMFRKPSIKNAQKHLNWTPTKKLEDSVEETLDFFLREFIENKNKK